MGDKDVDKSFAVLTSCAAPTYFDVIVKDGKSYMDGGCWANECADILMSGLIKSGCKNFKILNLSTGMNTPNTDSGNKTLVGWAVYMLQDWIARSSRSAIYECEAILGKNKVYNACPDYKKKIKMDKVDDDTINLVINIWDSYYDMHRQEILKFVKS